MRVTALVSFVGRVGNDMRKFARGDEFDLPVNVDWLQVGLVAATAPAPIEMAVDPTPLAAEQAVTRPRKVKQK